MAHAAARLSNTGADPLPGAPAAVSPWIGLAPCLFWMFIEFSRPMVWVPAVGLLKPGMIAGLWGLGAVLFMRHRPLPRPMYYIFAFATLMLFHVFTAYNNYMAYDKLKVDFGPLLLGCLLPLAVLPNSIAAMRILLTGYVLFHVPTAISALMYKGRGLGGNFGDENDLAFAVNSALAIALFLFLETRSAGKKLVLVLSMAVMVASVVASLSRGGFVGLAAFVVYLFVAERRARPTIVVLIVIGTVAVLALAPPIWFEDMATIQTAHTGGDTGDLRLYYWTIAWKMFLDDPIVGAGTENYGIRAPVYRDLERHSDPMWRRNSHSLYFTLIPEHGLVGVTIFVMLVVWFVRTHRRIQHGFRERPDDYEWRSAALMSSGLMASMVAVLVTGTFLSVLYYGPFWIFVALLASLEATLPRRAVVGEAPSSA